MKLSSLPSSSLERQRRYPLLEAFDQLLHWTLCASLMGVAGTVTYFIVVSNTPQILAHLSLLWGRLSG